jgi:glycine oxidase
VIGYGILGRWLAWSLQQSGFAVDVFAAVPADDQQATSFAAGGMIAPFSEMETGDPLIFQLGQIALNLWPKWINRLDEPVAFHERGSLIVAHPRDRQLWQDFQQKTCRFAATGEAATVHPEGLEPELPPAFSTGLYFNREQDVEPESILAALHSANRRLGVQLMPPQTVSYQRDQQALSAEYDYILDCRGIGARGELSTLRGVRGEAMLIHAPEVEFQRPLRILHPRYALYVVPRAERRYYLGATQIESESQHPITVRSSLELLSAAFSIHPGFAEASVINQYVGLRPAFRDHCPQIIQHGRWWFINGLFRHGFLLSPSVTQLVTQLLTASTNPPELAQKLVRSARQEEVLS